MKKEMAALLCAGLLTLTACAGPDIAPKREELPPQTEESDDLQTTLEAPTSAGAGETEIAADPVETEPRPSAVEPEEEAPAQEEREYTFSEGAVSMTVTLPAGWEAHEIRDGDVLWPADGARCGLRLWHEGSGNSYANLCFWDAFGVCGTGLTQEEREFSSGHSAWIGYYDGGEVWTFIVFTDTAGDYAVVNQGLSAKDAETVLAIMDSARIGAGELTRQEALDLARAAAEQLCPDTELQDTHPRFDPETGVLTFTFMDPAWETAAVVDVTPEGKAVPRENG